MIMRLYLRSGGVIDIPVESYEVQTSEESGRTTRLGWTSVTKGKRNPDGVFLRTIDPDCIEAVVQIGAIT